MAVSNGAGAVDHEARRQLAELAALQKSHDQLCDERVRNDETFRREMRVDVGEVKDLIAELKQDILAAYAEHKQDVSTQIAMMKSDHAGEMAREIQDVKSNKADIATLFNRFWGLAVALIAILLSTTGFLLVHYVLTGPQ